MTSPCIKWVGGKTKLLPILRASLPADIKERRYVEPFFGGGALFFDLQPRNAYLTDANAKLMAMYFSVGREPMQVIQELRILSERHNQMHYYRARNTFNTTDKLLSDAQRAALFIYLNKTCFNGLYRVNGNGDFNAPMGDCVTRAICDPQAIYDVALALGYVEPSQYPIGRNVCLGLGGFPIWELRTYATKNDFIYLDPPYLPVSKTSNFTSYTKDNFGLQEHVQLAALFAELDRRGCKIMLSNCAHPEIIALYSGFSVKKVEAARSINSDGAKRGPVEEILVTNY